MTGESACIGRQDVICLIQGEQQALSDLLDPDLSSVHSTTHQHIRMLHSPDT
jgi:hypothetical protein